MGGEMPDRSPEELWAMLEDQQRRNADLSDRNERLRKNLRMAHIDLAAMISALKKADVQIKNYRDFAVEMATAVIRFGRPKTFGLCPSCGPVEQASGRHDCDCPVGKAERYLDEMYLDGFEAEREGGERWVEKPL